MVDHPIPRTRAQNGPVPRDGADPLVVGLVVSPQRLEGVGVENMEATGECTNRQCRSLKLKHESGTAQRGGDRSRTFWAQATELIVSLLVDKSHNFDTAAVWAAHK